MRRFAWTISASLLVAACALSTGQYALGNRVIYATVSAGAYVLVVKSPLLRIRLVAAFVPAIAAFVFHLSTDTAVFIFIVAACGAVVCISADDLNSSLGASLARLGAP